MNGPHIGATVITDASYCHQTKTAGYGAWISMNGKRVQKSGVIKGSPANSTEAEFKAVLIGIWIAYQHGARDLLVQTDCMTVVQVLRNEPHAGQKVYRDYLKQARAEHFPDASIRARHVKGHSKTQDARSFVNRWCDAEAGKAMRNERKLRHPRRPTGVAAVNTAFDLQLETKYGVPLMSKSARRRLKKHPTTESFVAAMKGTTNG